MASLQDQLLNAGLIDTKKAKKANKEKRKQANVDRRSKDVKIDEAKQAAEASRAAKIEKDKALNREREEQAQQKAIAAQIKQLIHNHQKPKMQTGDNLGDNTEVEYNFTDGTTIKKMMVTNKVQKQIVHGVLTITRLDGAYYLVPSVVAAKIIQRDDSFIVATQTQEPEQQDEDDPYKDYVIPDDLMW